MVLSDDPPPKTEDQYSGASLSIDLDNAWAYRRAAGHLDWRQTESFLPLAIDRMVETLGSLDLPATVFLVGRDLEDGNDVDAIHHFGELSDWEPANHSWNHLPWLHTMSPEAIENEIAATERAVESNFGHRPIGFRGPGFSCPDEVLRVLHRRGYQYDASLFPTSLAPLARAVFLLRSNLRGEEREKAKKLYGGWRSMLLPNRPHRRCFQSEPTALSPHGSNQGFHEIPVTTMPGIRTPIHLTYLTFLASMSVPIAKMYFRTAMLMCRRMKTKPSLLLHPPDFLGGEDAPSLANFPGMKLSAQEKRSFTSWVLETFAASFEVRTLARTLPSSLQTITPEPSRSDRSEDRPQPIEVA